MYLPEAWIKAENEQKIILAYSPEQCVIKYDIPLTESAQIHSISREDLIRADWELVQIPKKHKAVFEDAEFSGIVTKDNQDFYVTDICRAQGGNRPQVFTRITLEWEDK